MSSRATLQQSHTSSTAVGRQGQAAATPACLGRKNLTLIPLAAAKGWGLSPLVLPDPSVLGGSEPVPCPALSREELDVHPSPPVQHPTLFLPDSQRHLGSELWVYMWMSIYSGTMYILGIYNERIWL